MTDEQKLSMLATIVGETRLEVLSTFLTIAGNKICRKAFPFDHRVMDVPDKYAELQVEIAAYLMNKRGAEGEVSHSENGIQRIYENADVPASMMRTIIPVAAVVGGVENEDSTPE